jgi:pimeloyl-ACP methyl ester carboxylesterase
MAAPHLVSRLPSSGARRHPLLFVHGAWHAAWCWGEHFLPWFAERGWECHALDLRGHGETPSDRSLRRLRIKHYVEDVAAVVDGLDRPPILVGHSMGGLVVQRYLERRDEIPAGVLLAPVPVGGVWRATFRVAARHPLRFLQANLTWRLWPIVATPRLARDAFFTEDTPDAEVELHHARMQDESYLAYLDMLVVTRPRPALVPAPVLVVAGGEDALFSVKSLTKTARAYGSDPVVIPGVGHDLMLDARWEHAAAAIAEWLEDGNAVGA